MRTAAYRPNPARPAGGMGARQRDGRSLCGVANVRALDAHPHVPGASTVRYVWSWVGSPWSLSRPPLFLSLAGVQPAYLTFALDTALAGAAAAASSAALRPRLAWALGTIFDGLRQAATGPEGDAVRSLVTQRADAAVALACTLTDDTDDKVRQQPCHALLPWCSDRLGSVEVMHVRILVSPRSGATPCARSASWCGSTPSTCAEPRRRPCSGAATSRAGCCWQSYINEQ